MALIIGKTILSYFLGKYNLVKNEAIVKLNYEEKFMYGPARDDLLILKNLED